MISGVVGVVVKIAAVGDVTGENEVTGVDVTIME